MSDYDDDYDDVDRPYHYHVHGETDADGRSKYEPIKVSGAWGFGEGFYAGSAIKYILRAPYKASEATDLKKAHWYLQLLCKEGYQRHSPYTPKFLRPDEVAQAWDLPDHLHKALDFISMGDYTEAACKVQLRLQEITKPR